MLCCVVLCFMLWHGVLIYVCAGVCGEASHIFLSSVCVACLMFGVLCLIFLAFLSLNVCVTHSPRSGAYVFNDLIVLLLP